jgi:putative transposase
VVLGVNLPGQKEVLGLWVAQTEVAKFWLQLLTEVRNRGVKDIFIACMDGLKDLVRAALTYSSLEIAQTSGRRLAGDLPPGDSGRGRATSGRVRE